MNRTGSVLPGAHSKIAICARSRAWWRAAQCLAGPVRSSALSLLVNRSRADEDLAGSDAALDDVRLAPGLTDVESYFMQCQGGDQGGEPVRDHGCDGTGAGADKTMLRGSPGSHVTSGSNRFRPCAGAAADVPGGALPVPVPPALL